MPSEDSLLHRELGRIIGLAREKKRQQPKSTLKVLQHRNKRSSAFIFLSFLEPGALQILSQHLVSEHDLVWCV